MSKTCTYHRRRIRIRKNSYSLMSWKLEGGIEKLCTIKDAPGGVTLRSEKYKGLEVELLRHEPQHAEIQLSIRLAMDGTDTSEYAYRLLQSQTLAGKIWSSPFSCLDAETIYRERWISSVGYCLPVTQLTDSQCEKIKARSSILLLQK